MHEHADACRVLELRRYTLHPERRDELIELFDTELVEPQEAVGMHVIGQFRDPDRADQFVWFRGFPDMAGRLDGLTGFYLEGEAWARHRDAANATMVDSDNVLLLRPVPGAAELCHSTGPRPAVGAAPAADAVYTVAIYPGDEGPDEAVARWQAAVDACGARLVGVLRTEHAPNNFPRLPIRSDVDVLVVVVRYDDDAQRRACLGRLDGQLAAPSELLVLEPTARSTLR